MERRREATERGRVAMIRLQVLEAFGKACGLFE